MGAQAMLVFTEVLLIAQYTYLIPTRLHCGAITSRLQAGFEKAGLHGNAFRCIPAFCVYLAILMHTYSLVRQKVGSLHCTPKGNANANSSADAQSLSALPSSCPHTAYSLVHQEVSRLVPILPAGQVSAQDYKTFSSFSAEILSDPHLQEPSRALLQRRTSLVASPRGAGAAFLRSPRQSLDGAERDRRPSGIHGFRRDAPFMPESYPAMTDATGLVTKIPYYMHAL